MIDLSTSLPFLLLKSARPRQWIKNFSLFASLLFSGLLFFDPIDGPPYALTVLIAFGIFCLLTSSVYIINDIVDYQADKNHPFKKRRPIASGQLSRKTAAFAAGILIAFVAVLSATYMTLFFQLLAASYLVLQVLYANYFKHIPILDVVSIALGFLIRVYAGAVVVNLHMSVWFLLTVISASLFLAVGKRQSERTLIQGSDQKDLGSTRKILKRYSQRLLDQFTAMFATSTWLTYAIFTFQNENANPKPQFESVYTLLPKALHSQKLLMLTLPFVILGVMRYLQLVYESNQGESPERVLLNDRPLLFTVFGFGILVFIVLYIIV